MKIPFEIIAFVFTIGIIWGSFLNLVGYRLITGKSIIFSRSRCPHCNEKIAWYDLFPIVSWFALHGKCRYCSEPISCLYPFIELLTGIIAVLFIFYVPFDYWTGYFILCSLLIVITRSDLEFMLISRYSTLFCIPLAWSCVYFHTIPLTMVESIRGAFFGYVLLYTIALFFYKTTKKMGIGQGDIDMLALIGSFTGILGCWATLLYGSIFGTLCSALYLYITGKSKTTRIPFGPFLALGALLFVLFYEQSIYLLIGYS